MDLMKMIAELRSQQAQIEEAILALEALAHGGGKRRGRPPKALSEDLEAGERDAPNPKRRKKHGVSAEARARMAEAQKKRWAAVRADTSGHAS